MRRGLDGARALRLLDRIRDEAPRRRHPDLAHRRLSGRRAGGIRRRCAGSSERPGSTTSASSPTRPRAGTGLVRLPDPRPRRGEGGAPPRDHGDPGRDLPARRTRPASAGRSTSSSRDPDAAAPGRWTGRGPLPGPGGRRHRPVLPAARNVRAARPHRPGRDRLGRRLRPLREARHEDERLRDPGRRSSASASSPWPRARPRAPVAALAYEAGAPRARLARLPPPRRRPLLRRRRRPRPGTPRSSGRPDPGRIVVDEVCGQLVARRLPARRPGSPSAVSFALFRFFDIIKPWPIRKLGGLPGGWGIMADDVGAGLAAAALARLVLLVV
ncbi:MAG: phosphatidylglycerophosphatase A [Candidatus Moduliflexus flocculans]|nr:phosphatidylglycerophosphatase A [Candidatus Moduliflexus flocculans]